MLFMRKMLIFVVVCATRLAKEQAPVFSGQKLYPLFCKYWDSLRGFRNSNSTKRQRRRVHAGNMYAFPKNSSSRTISFIYFALLYWRSNCHILLPVYLYFNLRFSSHLFRCCTPLGVV